MEDMGKDQSKGGEGGGSAKHPVSDQRRSSHPAQHQIRSPESRSPKEVRGSKPESTAAPARRPPPRSSPIRISDFGLPSVFGLRPSDFSRGRTSQSRPAE